MATKRKTTKKRRSRKPKSKSQAIRDYKAKYPNKGPSEIAAALTKRGVKVSPNLVSAAISKPKKKRAAPAKKRRRKATKRRAPSPSVSLDALLKARRFAQELGGVDKAQRALDGLRKVLG